MNTQHLSIEDLERLINTDAIGPDGTDIESQLPSGCDEAMLDIQRHLDDCAECQRKLSSAVGDASWWNKAQQYLSDDSLTDGTIEFQMDRGPDPLEVATSEQVLSAPSHPEMLGRLDEYDVHRVIGNGGMGVVYHGFDNQLNRPVAIKVLSPHLAGNGTARKRFEREARAAAAVVHPHVVPIHTVKANGKLPYIVMTLVPGQSLQAHVAANGPMDDRDVVRIAIQIASGLAAAHRQGLVHRDIKPANILMHHDLSRVMITDFGLARAADDAAMTQTGWLAGTPHYMSPEQSRGDRVDHRSDLFSLGSVLYYLITGREPFRAEKPVAVLHKICKDEPMDVRDLSPHAPAPLAAIIDKLLEKNPRDRFENAEQLQRNLERYLAYLEQPLHSAAPPRISTSRTRRKTRQMLGSAGFFTAVIALASVAAWLNFGNGAAPWKTTTVPSGSPGDNGGAVAPVDPMVGGLAALEEITARIANIEMSDQELVGEIEALSQDIEQTIWFIKNDAQTHWFQGTVSPESGWPPPAEQSNPGLDVPRSINPQNPGTIHPLNSDQSK